MSVTVLAPITASSVSPGPNHLSLTYRTGTVAGDLIIIIVDARLFGALGPSFTFDRPGFSVIASRQCQSTTPAANQFHYEAIIAGPASALGINVNYDNINNGVAMRMFTVQGSDGLLHNVQSRALDFAAGAVGLLVAPNPAPPPPGGLLFASGHNMVDSPPHPLWTIVEDTAFFFIGSVHLAAYTEVSTGTTVSMVSDFSKTFGIWFSWYLTDGATPGGLVLGLALGTTGLI